MAGLATSGGPHVHSVSQQSGKIITVTLQRAALSFGGRPRHQREAGAAVPALRLNDASTVATAELKNPLTRQGVEEAKEQYRNDRDPSELIEAVIGPAAKMLGSESPNLLKLRFHRALILFLGGDSRTALPEFDELADAYARTSGPSSDRALESRRYAAHCRANLGQNTLALDQFRQLLDDVTAADSHVSELALDVRHSIGMLLLSADDKAAAENVFESLYQDHLIVSGPEDERTREVADLLTRIRLNTSE